MKMNVYQEISQIIKEADGILIGASNGLSIAEGYNIFADDAWFQENMGDFREKYGLRCVLHGFSVPMKVEEKWAFVSRLVKAKAMQDEPSEIMKNIYALVKDKEYFVVTSNAEDHFVPAGFEADRVFEMEGKLTQIPRCPHCGAEMFPWVRGYGNFLQGKKYEEEYEKISKYIQKNKDRKILLIELGVGRMTPMFIQEPFWELTNSLKDAYYISVNSEYQFLPEFIEDKGIAILGDIGTVLKDLRKAKEESAFVC